MTNHTTSHMTNYMTNNTRDLVVGKIIIFRSISRVGFGVVPNELTGWIDGLNWWRESQFLALCVEPSNKWGFRTQNTISYDQTHDRTHNRKCSFHMFIFCDTNPSDKIFLYIKFPVRDRLSEPVHELIVNWSMNWSCEWLGDYCSQIIAWSVVLFASEFTRQNMHPNHTILTHNRSQVKFSTNRPMTSSLLWDSSEIWEFI